MLSTLSTSSRPFIHIVSDSTGDTVVKALRACLVQFPNQKTGEKLWSFVRTLEQLEHVTAAIRYHPGLVVFTFVDDTLRRQLIDFCIKENLPYVSVLDPIITALESYFGIKTEHQPGRQYVLDDAYFNRIRALEYAVNHDDGQGLGGLSDADVVLIGPSRLSKTPTCIYLAYRGVKAANVPLIKDTPLPPEVFHLPKRTLLVGLMHDPLHLQSIRQNRLQYLQDDITINYVELDSIKEELWQARRLYHQQGWPIIDTTRRSIEETAARILQLLSDDPL